MAILVAIAVNEDGYRKVLGAAQGMKADKHAGLCPATPYGSPPNEWDNEKYTNIKPLKRNPINTAI